MDGSRARKGGRETNQIVYLSFKEEIDDLIAGEGEGHPEAYLKVLLSGWKMTDEKEEADAGVSK